MKKKQARISSPDELNKNLSYNSPVTWIILGSVILLLAGFFVWSFIYKIQIKVFGTAHVANHVATLHVDEAKLNELTAGQKVYISGAQGQILSIDSNKQPVVSEFTLADGDYQCYIVIKEMKPIQFWLNN